MEINLLSVDQLEKSGARNLSEYFADQPGVDVKSDAGAGRGTVSIRGVTTGGQQTSPIVSFYIDDTAYGSSSAFLVGAGLALDLSLLDLNRIEVLRGPQGTLYGAGSMGGLIKYVTNVPDLYSFSAHGTLSGSVTDRGEASGTGSAVINVPLKEGVAGLRLAAYYERVGGYIDAVGPAAASNINDGNTTGARISLLLEPIDKLRIRLSGTGQTIKRNGTDQVDYNITSGRPIEGDLKSRLAVREPYEVKTAVGSAQVEYDFGFARLESITSAQYTDLENRNDFTSVYGPLLAGAVPNLGAVPFDGVASLHKETQEVRLTSAAGTVEWLVGYFYTHEEGTQSQLVTSSLTDGSAGPELANARLPSKYIESAFFGDVTWNLTKRLALTGGMRIAKNRQVFGQTSDGLLFGGATTISGSSEETAKTYLATARYNLTPASSVYLRAASGYRPGGPNFFYRDPTTGASLAPATFAHDTLWSYEAGYKADLLDKTLSVEAAIYDVEWKDLQQIIAVNGVAVAANGGKARIKGAELSTHWRPTTSLNAGLNVAWIQAALIEGAPGLAPAGTAMPNSARWSASPSLTYNFLAIDRPSYAGLSARFVGARHSGFAGSASIPDFKLPGYAAFDAQAGMDFQKFQVGLFMRNMFDRRALLSAATNYVPLGGPGLATPIRPRTLGINVSAAF